MLGWKYGDLITAITIIATAITIVVIAVYIVVCMSTIVYFARRPERTPWLHWLVPILGAAAFIPPLYYQYFPLPWYPLGRSLDRARPDRRWNRRHRFRSSTTPTSYFSKRPSASARSVLPETVPGLEPA